MQLRMFLRNVCIIALLKVSWSQLSAYSSAKMHSKAETAVTISSCVAFVSFEFSVSIVELHRRTLDVAVKNGGGLLSKHKVLLGKVKKHWWIHSPSFSHSVDHWIFMEAYRCFCHRHLWTWQVKTFLKDGLNGVILIYSYSHSCKCTFCWLQKLPLSLRYHLTEDGSKKIIQM